MNLETIIGLEIHIQLKTKSKMFCSCSNVGENQPPNTTVCQICLGHPGTLPFANQEAITMGAMLALALDGKINPVSIWARKNYFYPDLPKGYQISQFDKPLSTEGHLTIHVLGEEKRINIERLHLEEDAAKNFHSPEATLIDYNRAGTPLAEIVTKPDFRSPLEAKIFLTQLRLLARYLHVSDADMEKGHLRCDANISLKQVGEEKLHPKTEIKNLNSFRSVERALEYEMKRQLELWQLGTPPSKETTRGWDENKLITVEQRSKEDSADYRYFPEPDLPPLVFSEAQVTEIKNSLPELPKAKILRFIKEYQLNATDAITLVDDETVADYFEKVMTEARGWLEASGDPIGTSEEIWELNKKRLTKLVSGWLLSELFKLMNEAKTTIYDLKITPENFAEFIALIYERKVNSTTAQAVLRKMFVTGADPSHIIEEEDLGQISDEPALIQAVEKIIAGNLEQVAEYRQGKTPLLKYFIGLSMKEMKGKADPEKLAELFKSKLDDV
ncbi:MAG: Asp-tRNA(Asn)/Glu-tRNA(Gln) amidotransferase subunit GatB [Patescibacteria group bacterium]|jgi:aspartyl-tRNA(Asn)/glutamyl-tRNA(Gln) amidotransferase subunit B